MLAFNSLSSPKLNFGSLIFQAKNLTALQLTTIRGMIDDLTSQTSANVIKVLGLTSPPAG